MKNIFLLLVTLFLFSLYSCKNGKEKEVYYHDLQTLILGVVPSTDYFPYFVAEKQGIYTAMGLENFQIAKFATETELYTAFNAGDIDGMLTDYIQAIIEYSKGTPFRFVMNTESNYHLIAAKSSNISSLKDLKGKNIAISKNTISEYITDKIVNESTTLQLSEINKPEINRLSTRLDMLQSGQIDATVLPDLYATYAIRKGNVPIATTRELKFPVAGAAFSDKALSDKRREIEVLIRGYNKAVKYMNSNTQKEWIQLLVDNGDLSETLSEDIQLPDYTEAALPEKQHIQSTIDWLEEKKLIQNACSFDLLLDTIKGIRYK